MLHILRFPSLPVSKQSLLGTIPSAPIIISVIVVFIIMIMIMMIIIITNSDVGDGDDITAE